MEMRKRIRNVALVYPLFIFFIYKIVGNDAPDVYGRALGKGSQRQLSQSRDRLAETTPQFSSPSPQLQALLSELAPMQTIDDVIEKERKYMFNCGNMQEISILRKFDSGTSKQAYIGQYRDKFVVVKVVSPFSLDLPLCLYEFRQHGFAPEESRSNCIGHSNIKLLKEILLLHELSHPNLANLLGYCVRGSDIEQEDPRTHGVISVFEYGDSLRVEQLTALPWREKVGHAREIASLLSYFEKSPIGSVLIKDFKLGHIVASRSHLRLIDLDGYQAGRMPCEDGDCAQNIAFKNVKTTWPTIFKYLLHPDNFPEKLKPGVIELGRELENATVTGDFIISYLQKLNSTEHLSDRPL